MADRPPIPPGREAQPRFKKKAETQNTENAVDDLTRRVRSVIETASTFGTDITNKDLNDLTIATIGTALIDELLKVAFLTKLRRVPPKKEIDALFGPGGPIATFAAKASLGAVMGLATSSMKGDLTELGFIRNQFAHSAKLKTFSSPEIATACKRLRPIDGTLKENIGVSPERVRFVMAVLRIVVELVYTMSRAYSEMNLLIKYGDELKAKTHEMLDQMKPNLGKLLTPSQ